MAKPRERSESPKTEPGKDAGPMACSSKSRAEDAAWRRFAGLSALEQVNVDEERLRLLDLHLAALAAQPDAAAPAAAEAAVAHSPDERHRRQAGQHAARGSRHRCRQRHRLDGGAPGSAGPRPRARY